VPFDLFLLINPDGMAASPLMEQSPAPNKAERRRHNCESHHERTGIDNSVKNEKYDSPHREAQRRNGKW
jgi:hypothetical protein